MQKILIVGAGYAGVRIALAHRDRGDSVTITNRSGRADLTDIDGLPLDLDASRLPRLSVADRVYYTVPPAAEGVEDRRLARLLDALPVPAGFIYFGTTGVYGDCGGARVDETTPINPSTDRARRRAHAEALLQDWARGKNCQVLCLRIGGIYGPGRLPVDSVRSHKPVADPAETGPGNRIHVDDLVAAAIVLGDSGQDGTWNVTDGNPLPSADFNDLLADALGLPHRPRVPLESPHISPGTRSFLRESRLVDSSKLFSLAMFHPRYADPADGISESITM